MSFVNIGNPSQGKNNIEKKIGIEKLRYELDIYIMENMKKVIYIEENREIIYNIIGKVSISLKKRNGKLIFFTKRQTYI